MAFINIRYMIILLPFLLAKRLVELMEPHLKVYMFPVGEGDATIVECVDHMGNISLSLINAGSLNVRNFEIQSEYSGFLERILKKSGYHLRNIIITSNDPKHYNLIEPLTFFLDESVMSNIRFYVGGTRNDYFSLDYVFETYNNVYEFTRAEELYGRVSSCGHFDDVKNASAGADDGGKFHACVKRDRNGPIKNSNQIIDLCDNFQITVIAANYASSLNSKERSEFRVGRNSLVLKITPTNQASPSILLGDTGNDWENDDISKKYYSFMKDAHSMYYTKSTENVSLTLTEGLKSTLIKIPKNGAYTTESLEKLFYSDYVQPEFAVVSSDISDSHGHPRCLVLRLVNKYMMKFSARTKTAQCHSRAPKDIADLTLLELSENLFQTSVVFPRESPHGRVQFNLVMFHMTQEYLQKPESRALYHMLSFR